MKIFSSLILCVVSVCFLAECGLRAIAPTFVSNSTIQRDPLLGYVNKPNTQTNVYFFGRYFPVQINANGLRMSVDLSPQKPANQKRVLVLGDSFVFGWGLPLHQTLIGKLQERVDPSAKNTLLLNGGHGGWSTQQLLAFLQYKGPGFQPDAVLYLIGPDDLEQNPEIPLYTVDESGKLSSSPKAIKHWKNRSWLANHIPFYDTLLFNSYLLQALRSLNYQRSPTFTAEASLAGVDLSKKPTLANRQPSALTDALILRMKAICNEHQWQFWVGNNGVGSPSTLRYLRDLGPFLAQHGIPYLDATDFMVERVMRNPLPDVHVEDKTHFSEKANTLLDSQIGPKLSQLIEKL